MRGPDQRRLPAVPAARRRRARPGLVRTGDGPADGLPVEVWELPLQGYAQLQTQVPAPLGFGRLELSGGETVHGFVCEA